MWRASFHLAKKDLQSYLRDRTALVLGFLVPIILVTVFGVIMTYAFGGTDGMPKVTLWVVDETGSTASENVIANLRQSSMLTIKPAASDPPIARAKLQKMIEEGDAHHGLVFPEGYGASVSDSEEKSLVMLRDPGRGMEDRILQFALMQVLFADDQGQFWKRSLTKMFREEGMSNESLSQLESALEATNTTIRDFVAGQASPVENPPASDAPTSLPSAPAVPAATAEGEAGDAVAESSVTEPTSSVDPLSNFGRLLPIDHVDIEPPDRSIRINYQQAQSISGMSVMMLLFGMTSAGAILLAEREQGTLKRLLALPIAPESILLGKYLYVLVIGTMQMLILLIYGEIVFKVGMFRDPLTLSVLAFTWVATASAFGLMIATFATSSKQADGLATVAILAMAALGGCWFPVQMLSLPTPLAIVSKSTMTYWAMEGFQGLLWNGLNLLDGKILRALAVQWGWTVLLSGLSWWFYRRNYLR